MAHQPHFHLHMHKLHPLMHKLGEGAGTGLIKLVFKPVFIFAMLLMFLKATIRKPWLIAGNAVYMIKGIWWVLFWDMSPPTEEKHE